MSSGIPLSTTFPSYKTRTLSQNIWTKARLWLNHKSVHPYRTQEVVVEEAAHAMIGVDGRLMNTPKGPYRITVEQEVVNFLIPQ